MKINSLIKSRLSSTLIFFINVFFVMSLYLGQSVGMSCNDDMLMLAQHLYVSGNYYDAITEYKRVLFFHPEHSSKDNILGMMGFSYLALGENDMAWKMFGESISITVSDSLKTERRIAVAVLMIERNIYSGAIELLEIVQDDECLKTKALYVEGVMYSCMNEMSKCDLIRQKMTKNLISQNDKWSNYYLNYLENKKDFLISESKVEVMSRIIPGAGQIYSGYCKDGINAFLLNGTLVTYTVKNIIEKQYFNAAAIALLLNNYYRGNIYNAKKAAKNHNDKKSLGIKNSAVGYLKATIDIRKQWELQNAY